MLLKKGFYLKLEVKLTYLNKHFVQITFICSISFINHLGKFKSL